jgi:hypothetical protein
MGVFFWTRRRCPVNALGATRFRPRVEALEERVVPSVYSGTIVADAPLGYWRLGESDPSQPAMDSSGNGNNGAYMGGITLAVPGAIANDTDTAAGFDGASAYVDIPSTTGGPFNLHNNFSLEAWVINAGQGGGALDQAGRIFSNGAFAWGILNGVVGTRDGVRFTTFGHLDYDSNQTIVPEDGSWHYLAVTLDATNTARFYLDGVQTDSISGPAPANSTGSDLFIGKNPFTSAPEFFNGSIDEPAVYPYVMSPAQIGNHHNVGIGLGGGITPNVVSTSLTGTVRAPVSDDIVTFGEPVNPSTFTFDQFLLTDPNGNPVNGDNVSTSDNRTFDVTFDTQSTIGTYSVSIGPNIADFSGTTMLAPYTTTFTTTAALILNGGFETGDFTGWTQFGNTSFDSVSSANPHSGNYAARFGASGSESGIYQTIPTTPGANYDLSYWLFNAGGTPNSFHAQIDGVDIPGSQLTDVAAFAYTQYTFTFTAARSSTEVRFFFRQDPTHWNFDDVSVVASPAPPPAPPGGSGGDQSHGQQLAAFGAQLGALASQAAPAAPVAQGTTGWSHHASLQADQAALVDNVLSALDTKDDIGNLPSQPLSSNTPADPVGLARLWESPWLL